MPSSPDRVHFVLVALLLAAGGCSVSESDVPPWMRGPHWRFTHESSRSYDSDFVASGGTNYDNLSAARSGDFYGKMEPLGPSYTGGSPSSETPVRVQVLPAGTFIVKTPREDVSLSNVSSVLSTVEQNVPSQPREGGAQVVPVWARYEMPSDGIWYGLHSSPGDVADVAEELIRAGYLVELDVDEALHRQLVVDLADRWSRIESRVRFVTAGFDRPFDMGPSAPLDATNAPGFDDRSFPGSDPNSNNTPNMGNSVPGANDPFPGFGTTAPALDGSAPGLGGTNPGFGDSFPPPDRFGAGGAMPAESPFGGNTADLPPDLRALLGNPGTAETKSVLFSDDDLKLWQSIVFVVDSHSENAWGNFAESQVTNATQRLTAEQKGETIVNFWLTLQKFKAGTGLAGDSLESLLSTALSKKPGVIYVMTDRDLPEEAVATLRSENQAAARIEVRFFDDLLQPTEAKNLENLASGSGGSVAHYKQRLPGE